MACRAGCTGYDLLVLLVAQYWVLCVQAVNVLLMAGANVELKCSTGADVLHCAAESGCLEVFERIVQVRAATL